MNIGEIIAEVNERSPNTFHEETNAEECERKVKAEMGKVD